MSARPDQWGRWVEAAIGAHLVNNQLSEGYTLHYWRHQNDEIDFVLERKGKVIGLEVKSGATQKAPGMEAFKKQHQPEKVLLVGNSGIPWQEFLKMNPTDLFNDIGDYQTFENKSKILGYSVLNK